MSNQEQKIEKSQLYSIKRVVWDAPSTTDETKVRTLDLLITKHNQDQESEGPTGEASYQLDARWHQRTRETMDLSVNLDASREYVGLFIS